MFLRELFLNVVPTGRETFSASSSFRLLIRLNRCANIRFNRGKKNRCGNRQEAREVASSQVFALSLPFLSFYIFLCESFQFSSLSLNRRESSTAFRVRERIDGWIVCEGIRVTSVS